MGWISPLTMKDRLVSIPLTVSLPPTPLHPSSLPPPPLRKARDANVHYYNQNQLSTMPHRSQMRSPCHSLHQLWINFPPKIFTLAPQLREIMALTERERGKRFLSNLLSGCHNLSWSYSSERWGRFITDDVCGGSTTMGAVPCRVLVSLVSFLVRPKP